MWNLALLLELMFRVLLPQVISPLALYRFPGAHDLDAVMLECHPPKGTVELNEMVEHFFKLHVEERLILDIAIDVRR